MEYSPKSVKLSVVGRGAAQKAQVAFMVRALRELRETPESDAADALAIGLQKRWGRSMPPATSSSVIRRLSLIHIYWQEGPTR